MNEVDASPRTESSKVGKALPPLREGTRITQLDVPVRDYDVDTLLVDLNDNDQPPEPESGVCRTLEDVFEPDARFAIQEYFAEFLESASLTASELLHRTDLQERLRAWPGHGKVIDQISFIQARPGRWTAGTRGDELRALEAAITDQTRQRGHKGPPPGLNPKRLSAFVKQTAGGMAAFEARFAVDAALSAWLAPTSTYSEKLMQLLALDGDDLSDDALVVVDQVIGEIMVSATGAREVVSSIETLGERVEALAEMWQGRVPMAAGVSSLLRRLANFVGRLKGGRTRRGIERAIHRILEGEGRLSPCVNPFDLYKVSSIIDEMTAGKILLDNLNTSLGMIGGERTRFLVDQRMTRLLTGDELNNLFRGKNHQTRITELLAIEAAAHGETCRATLAEIIHQHFSQRDFVQKIFEMVRTPMGRLKVLSELHHALTASGLPEDDKASDLRMLDEVQYTFMRTNRILSRITGEGVPVSDVTEFIALLADGTIIEGKSAGAIRALIDRHLRSVNFIKALAGQELQKGETRAGHYAGFFEKAKAAGLMTRRMEEVRILLADDEPQAREYIAMILADLGITRVDQAADGTQALSLFNQDQDGYDLIVCDWRMPKMSGMEVLKFVRASRPLQPFLMATALSTLIAVEEAMAYDVTAYVAKPFTPEQLETKVIALLFRDNGVPAP